MKPNKIGECGVDRKFPSHVVFCIYSIIGPHGPSSSIEDVRCSIASVVIILKLNIVIILERAWSSIRQYEFSGVTSGTMSLSVMDATEVAKKGIATGCDRKRCFGPVESRVGSRIKMKANRLRSCCCDGKYVNLERENRAV
ncbi:hypothetical protein SADUNF_Sadunf17G0093400 [Salix dunnii]|uniref:Uncharacterized protein n=1 Tax=Salix dunnii TaxID=1413687 RepID=A0A835J6Q8_9ROSI|nr:hypothetical protein SADUNF_Sadunf17G0093400 [Salix dunnii]